MLSLTDAELLRRYAESHSEEAFAELVRRHLSLVFNTALRRVGGDTHRAEEIAQTVFTDLARKASSLTRHPALTGWLHTSTRYAAAELVRREQRRQLREQEALLMPDDSAHALDWEHLRPVIDNALDQLDERDRAAVLLRFFENQQFSEIGQSLALSEDAARKRIDRALEKLRRQLAKRGIASTGTVLGLALANNIATAAPIGLAQSIVSSSAQIAPATATLTFMVTSKIVTVATALAAVVAVGLALHESHAAHSMQTELEQRRSELASIRSLVAEEEKQTVRLQPVAATVTRPPTLDDITDAERERGDKFLAAHPEVRDALTRATQARIRGRYLALYQSLHLSEAQIAEFEKLMLGASGKVWRSAGDLWLGEKMDFGERDLRVKNLLGDEGFARFLALRYDGAGGRVAQEISKSLALTDQPLTSSQIETVEHVIEKARADNPGLADVWPVILPQLQSTLTPQQFEDSAFVYLNAQYRAAEKIQPANTASK
jgi:RNA polymerase sigma factor (sigma-70 family)